MSIFGTALIIMALLFAAFSVVFRSNHRVQQVSSIVAYSSIFVASLLLVCAIFLNDFSIAYVFANSSENLPAYLKVASLYSGEEGTFLLWNLFISLVGFYVVRKDCERRYPESALTIYNVVFLVFLLLLITNSPFRTIWNRYPDYFTQGEIPLDGRSLNPLLESIWMVVHPPILFLGYTLLILPAVLTVSKLISKNYATEIADEIRKFQLWGTSLLGVGIMLGGLWAYESLGWGGWWAWDPVENVSLLPWLIAVILIHTSILYRRKNYFPKTNIMLFCLQFVLILFSTFLTRTGIATNSMHTFAGSNASVFFILLTAMIVSVVLVSVIIYRNKEDLRGKEIDINLRNSEFYMVLGVLLIAVMATFILIGTLLPVISGQFDIKTTYFDSVNYIPCCLVLLCIAIIELLYSVRYRSRNNTVLYVVVLIALSFGIIYIVSPKLLLSLLLWSAIIASLSVVLSFCLHRKNAMSKLSHLGIAIMFVGVVVSTSDKSFSSIISLGQSESFTQNNDYTAKYLCSEQIADERTGRDRYRFIIEVKDKNSDFRLKPNIMFNGNNLYKEPAIAAGFIRDCYAEPLALDSAVRVGKTNKTEVFTFRLSFKYLMSLIFFGGFICSVAIGLRTFKKIHK